MRTETRLADAAAAANAFCATPTFAFAASVLTAGVVFGAEKAVAAVARARREPRRESIVEIMPSSKVESQISDQRGMVAWRVEFLA